MILQSEIKNKSEKALVSSCSENQNDVFLRYNYCCASDTMMRNLLYLCDKNNTS